MSESLSVLLVEDDPIQRSLAHRILSLEARLSVFTAADGLEGLAFALQRHPQVILLDLILPGISGLELLRRYRDQGGTAKVLALSQAPGQWVCDAALAAGADFFFPKPVHWGEVLRLLLFLCDDLTSRCRALLLKLGAPADWAGFSKTALAAGLLAGRRCQLMKEVYIETARQFQTSPAGVEVNIRRLISHLYRKGGPPLPEPFPPPGRPPSNKDFLRIMVQAVTFPL